MDILFAILVLLGPAIIKSVKEKKTAEEKRRYTPSNRPKERPVRKPNKPISVDNVDNIEIEEVNIDTKEETYKNKLKEEKLEREYEELKSKVEEVSKIKEVLKEKEQLARKKKPSYSLNELTKEDILKGIVLKEVLSEPKCMQNRMR
ncbi:MAG: hypothetical protein KZY61_08145 [Clostridiaceae bacterium]|nr:hypothetical protein [Clostridiaceae bacterium]MBW4859646.1 hypothetical protein [Clostridiaceae bacterium]MBW4868615.1 hypothetical protein [Clostridiaceae bacterium]